MRGHETIVNHMKYSPILFLLLLIAGCGSDAASAHAPAGESPDTTNQTPSMDKQLRHVVLFKFKEDASKADIAKVEEAFAALPAKITAIKGFEWGTNNSPEGLDKGFTHCFLLTFDSEEDRATYLPHPDHKAFGEIAGPVLEDVLVVDFWAGE